jgi:hypothetical protein
LDLVAVDVVEYTAIVWAKVKGYPWWPAQIMEEYHEGVHKSRSGSYAVAFTSSGERSTLKSEFIKAWEPYFDTYAHLNKSRVFVASPLSFFISLSGLTLTRLFDVGKDCLKLWRKAKPYLKSLWNEKLLRKDFNKKMKSNRSRMISRMIHLKKQRPM